MTGRLAVEVAFTDLNGVHWIRRAGGQLKELPEAPLDYFGDTGCMGRMSFRVPSPLQ
jgi:hypothetical protein